jgi:adenosylhomocysteine nucleosidase
MPSSVTLVLGAVPSETKPVVAALVGARAGKLRRFPYHSGRIGKHRVVVAITGVGKTNAAFITTLFITHFKPLRLLYTGTGARINHALRTGDVILGREMFHYDAGSLRDDGMLYRKIIGPVAGRQTHFRYRADPGLLGLAKLAAASHAPKPVTLDGGTYVPAVRAGRIGSGDLFGMNQERIDDVRAKLKCDLIEMEGAAVAQVCDELRVPHLVIRGGSNLAQPDPGHDYKARGQIAARRAAAFTVHLIRELK